LLEHSLSAEHGQPFACKPDSAIHSHNPPWQLKPEQQFPLFVHAKPTALQFAHNPSKHDPELHALFVTQSQPFAVHPHRPLVSPGRIAQIFEQH